MMEDNRMSSNGKKRLQSIKSKLQDDNYLWNIQGQWTEPRSSTWPANDENCFTVAHGELMQESADLFKFRVRLGSRTCRRPPNQLVRSLKSNHNLKTSVCGSVTASNSRQTKTQSGGRCNGPWRLFILDIGDRCVVDCGGASSESRPSRT